MRLFLSTYINKIDKKGRVSVPAHFRNVILSRVADPDFQGIIVYSSFLTKSIEASTFDRLLELNQSIDTLDPYSDERNAFATVILGGSFQLSFDNEGRVTLPEELISYANINENALFVGKGTTFEIWNPETFKEYFAKAKEMAKENRSLLHLEKKEKNDK